MSVMRRVRALLVALFALCVLAAQSDAASPRIGFLSPGTPESSATVLAGLRDGLRENGFTDGGNVVIEARYAHGRFERLPELARELVALPVDVLVTFVTQASLAARDATKTIPIVMLGVSDPAGAGLVSSLSRPGGNITGTAGMFSESAGKRLELLLEAVPGIRRVAVLFNPANRVFQSQQVRETEEAARRLGVELRLFEARDVASIERAFATFAKEGVTGLNVLPDPILVAAHAPTIAALAQRSRLPSVSANGTYAEAGGLIAYGPSFHEMGRSSGGYVAKILKGAKPAELPVEQPTRFELWVNLKTARQLGITVAQSLLLRADRVIE
jgi:putative ABC transport system substrate-binding protein